MIARALLCALLLAVAPPALAQDAALIARGKALFQGEAGTGLAIRLGQRAVPARGISCAGCHGGDAGGGAELQSGPAIDGAALAARGYDAGALSDALIDGRRPDGSAIGQTMPRFAFKNPNDVAALDAYLQVVATIQRTGTSADRITLRQGAPGAAPFWQAFQQAVAAAAPNGVFGRRISLSEDQPALATIGRQDFDPTDDAPQLFPLAALLGDEDPARIRAASASLVAQIRRAAEGEDDVQVLASPPLRDRLRALLAGEEGITLSEGAPDSSRAVFAADPDALQQVLGQGMTAPIYVSIDDLARLDSAPTDCVIAVDPRPSDQPGAPLARYGQIAGMLMVEALKACGPDCTRARLMRAFDGLRLDDPRWPALDYRAHPLTGSAASALWQVCAGRARALP